MYHCVLGASEVSGFSSSGVNTARYTGVIKGVVSRNDACLFCQLQVALNVIFLPKYRYDTFTLNETVRLVDALDKKL
jgi:hypothetical protein